MKTIKLSYSVLLNWSQGRIDEAVAQYLGKPIPDTPQMQLGRIKHEIWANYTLKHGSMHPEVGGDPMFEPMVEKKYEKLLPFSDDYQILLRGVLDAFDAPPFLDGERIIEYKSGMGTATSYVDSLQTDYYKLLRPKAVLAEYRCYNPYFKTFTKGIKFLSDKNSEMALNHIYTYGGEMLDYLLMNKLLINYKPEIYTK
jgi:hypothetical protein